MKNFNLLFVLLICFGFSSQVSLAQKNTSHKYKVWVKSKDHTMNIDGYLNKIDDNALTLMKSGGYEKTVSWEDIKSVKLRKKGNIKRGLLYGFITGVGLGGIVGFSTGGGFVSRRNSALVGGIPLGLLGGIIGGGIGSIKDYIPINGNEKGQKEKLKKYLLTPQ